MALHSEPSALTVILNDYGSEEAFARQVEAHGRPGDVLVAMSTSGASRNVLAAADRAHSIGVRTWGIGGPKPNQLADRCDEILGDRPTQTVHRRPMHADLHGRLGHAYAPMTARHAEVGRGRVVLYEA